MRNLRLDYLFRFFKLEPVHLLLDLFSVFGLLFLILTHGVLIFAVVLLTPSTLLLSRVFLPTQLNCNIGDYLFLNNLNKELKNSPKPHVAF